MCACDENLKRMREWIFKRMREWILKRMREWIFISSECYENLKRMERIKGMREWMKRL